MKSAQSNVQLSFGQSEIMLDRLHKLSGMKEETKVFEAYDIEIINGEKTPKTIKEPLTFDDK